MKLHADGIPAMRSLSNHRKRFGITQGLQLLLVLIVALCTIVVGQWYLAAPRGDLPGGPFHLFDLQGKTVTEQDMTAPVTLLTFGYTRCPSACAYLLDETVRQIQTLAPQAQKRISLIFVTLDPERDDAAAIRAYLAQWSLPIQGWLGTPEQVEVIADAYRIFYAQVPTGSHDGGYVLDYTSVVYALGETGDYLTHMGDQDDPVSFMERIKEFL